MRSVSRARAYPAGETCDGTGTCRFGASQRCDFSSTVCANSKDSCQLWVGGTPKYGDYNGNACAVGHFYTVWASATPANSDHTIDLFFKVRDTVPPLAQCKNVTVPTDLNLCSAASAPVDNGSTDPDNNTFSLDQSPSGPYPQGTTGMTLTSQIRMDR
jgi:hypothetical protein